MMSLQIEENFMVHNMKSPFQMPLGASPKNKPQPQPFSASLRNHAENELQRSEHTRLAKISADNVRDGKRPESSEQLSYRGKIA
jgi:hypothetical protein